jgi:hypothetical protein
MKKTLSILIFVITSWTNAAAQNLDSAAVETLMDQAMQVTKMAWRNVWRNTRRSGVTIANEEGKLIAGAIGSYRYVLLANHGMLTAGNSI